jgi:hypothetical protein
MPRPPDYGIIYNWDGAPHGYSEYPQTMEQFLDKMYAPLENTQVGAHFWCLGEHTARWESNVLEKVGGVQGRVYDDAYQYTFNENIHAMIERGEDPQAATIKRGHELGMQVYASVRMNDNHFNGAQVEDLPHLRHSSLTQMHHEHPEWLLGEKAASDWFALSWDLSVPEVRKHRFEHVQEVCTLWDWDGVELDWQRHGFHLDQDYGYRLRYVLTDLLRAIRRMTDEVARKRGRPFYLAVRVSGTLEMCRTIGYDIPTWIREGLVDILIPAASSGTDPLIDIPRFLELTEGTDVVVYGGVYGGPDGPHGGPEDELKKRDMFMMGLASRFYYLGAKGIHVFNWHANRDSRRALLTSIGASQTLRGKDKIYAAAHRILWRQGAWRGAGLNDRIWAEVPVALKQTLTGDGPVVALLVAADTEAEVPQSIELRLRLEEWVVGDRVRVKWDGVDLPAPAIAYSQDPIADVASAVWLSHPLSPQQASRGEHQVQVILDERNPHLASDLILADVEVVLRYGHSQ